MDLHPQTVFDAIGGEAPLRRLVDAFYDRMDTAPAYAGIRALHPAELSGSRDKLFWFLCRLLTAFFQTADWMRNQAEVPAEPQAGS